MDSVLSLLLLPCTTCLQNLCTNTLDLVRRTGCGRLSHVVLEHFALEVRANHAGIRVSATDLWVAAVAAHENPFKTHVLYYWRAKTCRAQDQSASTAMRHCESAPDRTQRAHSMRRRD